MFGPLPILALLPLLAAQLQLARAVNLTPRNLQSVTWLQVIQAPSGAYECPYTCSYHNMQHVNGGRNLAPDNSDPKLALCGSTQGFYSGYMMAGMYYQEAAFGVEAKTCDVPNAGQYTQGYYCGCVPKEKRIGRGLGQTIITFQAWSTGPTWDCPSGFSRQQGGKYSTVCRYRESFNDNGKSVYKINIGYQTKLSTPGQELTCVMPFDGTPLGSQQFDRLCVRSSFRFWGGL